MIYDEEIGELITKHLVKDNSDMDEDYINKQLNDYDLDLNRIGKLIRELQRKIKRGYAMGTYDGEIDFKNQDTRSIDKLVNKKG